MVTFTNPDEQAYSYGTPVYKKEPAGLSRIIMHLSFGLITSSSQANAVLLFLTICFFAVSFFLFSSEPENHSHESTEYKMHVLKEHTHP